MKRMLLLSAVFLAVLTGSIFLLEKRDKDSMSTPDSKPDDKKENESYEQEELLIENDEEYEHGDYQYFKTVNRDLKLVLHFEDRDLPVVIASDNEFYVRRDLSKSTGSMGTPFIDCNTGSEGRNVVIHGHSSDRNERMFTFFKYYVDDEYAKEHQYFEAEYEDSVKVMKVFAVLKIDLDKDVWRDWLKAEWRNEDEFMKFIEEVKGRSLVDLSAEIHPNEKIMTLVTCDMEIENGRIIVFAKCEE